jgi:hypothetical protein
VRELVDERPFRASAQYGVEVHFLEGRAVVGHDPSRHDFEVAALLGGKPTPVGLDETDDDVDATSLRAPTFIQHRVGLADSRGRAEVHAQGTAAGAVGSGAIGRGREAHDSMVPHFSAERRTVLARS